MITLENAIVYIVVIESTTDDSVYEWSEAYAKASDAHDLMVKWQEENKSDDEVRVKMVSFGVKG